MAHIWDLIEKHMQDGPYAPSIRQVAMRLGVSPTTLTNWRDGVSLPAHRFLDGIAALTGTSEDEVLAAYARDVKDRKLSHEAGRNDTLAEAADSDQASDEEIEQEIRDLNEEP